MGPSGRISLNNLVKQSLKLPQGQRAAWVAQKSREEEKTQAKIVGKQVEEILSPRQLEVYKREAFPDLACAMLRYPEFLKTIGATPEQKERLAKIQEQLERQTQEQERRYNEQSLAVLSPQQQEKLRAEIRRADEPPADGTAVWGGTISVTFGSYLETNVPDSSETLPDTEWGVPADGELTAGAYRRQLGFSAAQEKRWQEITANYHKENETARTTEQWRRLVADFRRQVEGILTPQQATALKETRLHNKLRGLPEVGELVKSFDITEKQRARLRRLAAEFGLGVDSAWREAQEKALAVPTPAQRQKLREELDRQGAW